MKKKMKSVTRKLSGIFLAIMMMVASSMSVFAATTDETDVANAENVSATAETRAGNETWTGSGFGGAYTFTDYNLTPVKTMGESGTLLIHGSFYGNDGYANVSPIKLTAQIRNTAGGVKAQTVVVDDRSGYVSFSVSCNVSKGEQIQFFVDASSIPNPPGILRSAYVEYSYVIM